MAQAKKTIEKEAIVTKKPKTGAAKAAAAARTRAIRRAEKARDARPIGGFMDFVREQGVVGLAVGLALGTQVKTVVDAIVASFINPLVGLVLPGSGDLTKKTFSFTAGSKTAVFAYGNFLNVLIGFVAVAAVIYFVVKGLKLDKLDKKKEA